MIVLFLFILCMYDDELYFLFENLHHYLNDFVILVWYMAVTLILSYVRFLRRILAQTPLEPLTGYNHQHCLCIMSRTLGSGTHGTWHPKCLYYPKGSYYQGLNLEYMTSCDIEVNHLVHINNEKNIPYILQTLKCYWAWTQIICWDEKMNMLINFYSSGHQFTKKIITR